MRPRLLPPRQALKTMSMEDFLSSIPQVDKQSETLVQADKIEMTINGFQRTQTVRADYVKH
jgi:hypothetical protein